VDGAAAHATAWICVDLNWPNGAFTLGRMSSDLSSDMRESTRTHVRRQSLRVPGIVYI